MDLVSDEHYLEGLEEQMTGEDQREPASGRDQRGTRQRTTGRDQRGSQAEPEGNQGGAEGGIQGGADARWRKSLQPEGLKSSAARQSSHPDADDPMGAVVVQSRAGQRSQQVPNHFRGRQRVKVHS